MSHAEGIGLDDSTRQKARKSSLATLSLWRTVRDLVRGQEQVERSRKDTQEGAWASPHMCTHTQLHTDTHDLNSKTEGTVSDVTTFTLTFKNSLSSSIDSLIFSPSHVLCSTQQFPHPLCLPRCQTGQSWTNPAAPDPENKPDPREYRALTAVRSFR